MFAGTAFDGLALAAAIAFWAVPFVGYIVAFYDLPLLAPFPPPLRMACLTIGSLVVTFASGFAVWMVLPGVG